MGGIRRKTRTKRLSSTFSWLILPLLWKSRDFDFCLKKSLHKKKHDKKNKQKKLAITVTVVAPLSHPRRHTLSCRQWLLDFYSGIVFSYLSVFSMRLGFCRKCSYMYNFPLPPPPTPCIFRSILRFLFQISVFEKEKLKKKVTNKRKKRQKPSFSPVVISWLYMERKKRLWMDSLSSNENGKITSLKFCQHPETITTHYWKWKKTHKKIATLTMLDFTNAKSNLLYSEEKKI